METVYYTRCCVQESFVVKLAIGRAEDGADRGGKTAICRSVATITQFQSHGISLLSFDFRFKTDILSLRHSARRSQNVESRSEIIA